MWSTTKASTIFFFLGGDRTGDGMFAICCRRFSMDWTRAGESGDRGVHERIGDDGDMPVLVEVRRRDFNAASISCNASVVFLYALGYVRCRCASLSASMVDSCPASTAAPLGLSSRGESGRRRGGAGRRSCARQEEEGDPSSGPNKEPPSWLRGVVRGPPSSRTSCRSLRSRAQTAPDDPGDAPDVGALPFLTAGDGMPFRSEPVRRRGGDRFLRRPRPPRPPGVRSLAAYGDSIK